jgi:hypothetical protein
LIRFEQLQMFCTRPFDWSAQKNSVTRVSHAYQNACLLLKLFFTSSSSHGLLLGVENFVQKVFKRFASCKAAKRRLLCDVCSRNPAASSGLKGAGCVSLAGGFVDARGEIDDASLRRIFRQFDHGGDGHLDGSELKLSPRTRLSCLACTLKLVSAMQFVFSLEPGPCCADVLGV